MDLQKLRYFNTVAKVQHITRAAEQIGIAQPALTQAIKTLEKELGVELLAKKGRNVVLTEFGAFLHNRLENLLPEFDGLSSELHQLRHQLSKRVKLNILAASTFVINAIVSYRQDHPDVVFDFEQSEQKHDCDIVIKTNGFDHNVKSHYSKRCIKEERIYLAVPKDSSYAQMDSIDLRTVKDESFVMLSSSRLFGTICNKYCSVAGFLPKILFESDSPSAVQNIISTGTGVAFWPEYSWGAADNKHVVLLPISYPVCQRELILELSDHAAQSQYAEDFYNHLIQSIK